MITIRAARPADAAPMAAIYAPHVVSGTVSFETEAPDAAVMRDRMAASGGLYPWLVATSGSGEDAAVVGYAYATRFRERAAYRFVVETSIYLCGSVQRQGVGRRLYGALLATLRVQGFTQAMGVIALPNDPSVSLHEAAGFAKVGMFREVGYKHGQWVDVGFWQCVLSESTVPPSEPRRFADVGLFTA